MERVAEFKVELRATQGRLAWAAKDKIVEVLHEGAPLIRRAPRYPVMVLVIFERVVMDDSEPTGLRVYAWAKLVKVWASLRWSDLQAIRPGELKLVEGRLATTLRRTKTSGPNRHIKEMPLCVSQAPPIVLDSVPDMEVEGPDADSDSQEHPEPPAAKVPRAED